MTVAAAADSRTSARRDELFALPLGRARPYATYELQRSTPSVAVTIAEMLHEFVESNREAIISRARERVTARTCPRPNDGELDQGMPVFLGQLSDALRMADDTDGSIYRELGQLATAAICCASGSRCTGRSRLRRRAPNDHRACHRTPCADRGAGVPDSQPVFRRRHRGCRDEYARQRERAITDQGTERLGELSHELRNLLNTAMLSLEIIKLGQVAAAGSTGLVLGRSLKGLRDLIVA